MLIKYHSAGHMLFNILLHHCIIEIFLYFGLLNLVLDLYQIFKIKIVLFPICHTLSPWIFTIIFGHVTLSLLRIPIQILKILFNIFLLTIQMLHQFHKYRYPLLFDKVIIACKFPSRLIFIFFWLELITLVCKCFTNILSFHQIFIVEIDFKCRTCFTWTCYFLYFCYLD